MILDGNSADPLLEQFKSAQDAEGVAIAALHDAMKGGTDDKEILMTLTDRMTDAHNKKMDVWDQLQQFQLDK